MSFDKIKLSDLDRVNVPVKLNKILSTEAIWINRRENHELDNGENTAAITETVFLDRYSFVVADSSLFDGAQIDRSSEVVWYAERYGGIGCGGNAGGARVVHNGSIQLKGNGANCLAKKGTGFYHRYGGLDLHSAVQEIVYTTVLNKILPHGIAKIYGLISTGVKCGHYGSSSRDLIKTWGVILVREAMVRPAHFLRGWITPQDKFKSLLSVGSDVARVRTTNRYLKKLFPSQDEYIRELAKFLTKWASQMAFARVARIAHASLVPSNITLLGKWIDVPGSSFHLSGVNVDRTNGIFWAFMQEPVQIELVLREMVHTYCKYNSEIININGLIAFYRKQFDSFYKYHIQYLICLPFEYVSADMIDYWTTFYYSVKKIIDIDSDENGPAYTLPSVDDPIAIFMENCLLSFSDSGFAESEDQTNDFRAFRNIVINVYKNLYQDEFLLKSFLILLAFRILKKIRLTSIYYPLIMEKELIAVCHTESALSAQWIIEAYEDLTDWIFEEESNVVTVFRTKTLKIIYQAASGTYCVGLNNTFMGEFDNFDAVTNFIIGLESRHYTIGEFDFMIYFRSCENVINQLERAPII